MSKDIEKNVLKEIGNNIKTARILKGLTQEYVAERLDKSINFISLLERGQTGLSINSIIDICNILEIDPNAIFNGLINCNSKDDFIVNSICSLSNEDKRIVNELIEYILKKNNK